MKLYNKNDFKYNLKLSCVLSIIISLIPVLIRIIKYAHLNEYGVWTWLVLFVYWIICFLISIIALYVIIFLITVFTKNIKRKLENEK